MAPTATRCLLRQAPCVRSIPSAANRAPRSIATLSPPYLDFLAPAWIDSKSPSSKSRSYSTAVARSPQRSCLMRSREHSVTTFGLPRRRFSTSPTTQASTKAILNPRTGEDGEPLTINITPRAAHRLQTIATTDQNPDLALRVSVESGGCHGFQYLMSLTSTKDVNVEEDTIFESEEVVTGRAGEAPPLEGYRARVVMDEPSLELLKGSSVDYTMELIGSQFKVVGIPGATSSCGCGTSFDIAV